MKAKTLLNKLESNTDYKEQVNRFDESSFTSILVKLYLINAKLTSNKEERKKYCQNILTILESKKSKSIYYTFPLIQAHICLNKEAEIKDLKNHLIKLGISKFEL